MNLCDAVLPASAQSEVDKRAGRANACAFGTSKTKIRSASPPQSCLRDEALDAFIAIPRRECILRFDDVEEQVQLRHAFAKGVEQRLIAAFNGNQLFDILLIAVCQRQNADANG